MSGSVGVRSKSPMERWEWRSFEYHQRRWRLALEAATQVDRGVLVRETYLFTRVGEAIVVVSEGTLAVRSLVETRPRGVERWESSVPHTFPLMPDLLAPLWANGLPAVPMADQLASADHLLSLVDRQLPDIQVLPARAWRRYFVLEECRIELVTMQAEGQLIESLGLSTSDPDALTAVLVRLGIADLASQSELAAFRRLVGWGGSAKR